MPSSMSGLHLGLLGKAPMGHGTMDSECVGLERTDGVPSTAWKTRKHSIDSGDRSWSCQEYALWRSFGVLGSPY